MDSFAFYVRMIALHKSKSRSKDRWFRRDRLKGFESTGLFVDKTSESLHGFGQQTSIHGECYAHASRSGGPEGRPRNHDNPFLFEEVHSKLFGIACYVFEIRKDIKGSGWLMHSDARHTFQRFIHQISSQLEFINH